MVTEVWIDEDDLEIIKYMISSFKTKESITTYNIAKNIFPNEDKHLIEDKIPFVWSRLKKLKRYGLINIFDEKGTKIFEVMVEKFKLNKIPKIKKSISLKINGKWVVFEL